KVMNPQWQPFELLRRDLWHRASSSDPGSLAVSAPAGGRRGSWDVHRARGDALVTVWAVLLQLYWMSARRVPRARSRADERPAPDRQRPHHETEPTPAVRESVRGARRPL